MEISCDVSGKQSWLRLIVLNCLHSNCLHVVYNSLHIGMKSQKKKWRRNN